MFSPCGLAQVILIHAAILLVELCVPVSPPQGVPLRHLDRLTRIAVLNQTPIVYLPKPTKPGNILRTSTINLKRVFNIP
jgi:hypothetical protein